MTLKNDGITVGELSITIVTLVIIGFIWTNLTKNRGDQEVSRFITNSSEISYKQFLVKKYPLIII